MNKDKDNINYARFQWSQFFGDGGQVVVRGDEFEEFILNVEVTKNQFVSSPTAAVQSAQTTNPVKINSTAGVKICDNCGSKLNFKEGVSKSGKPYKGWFCPLPKEECGAAPIWVRD